MNYTDIISIDEGFQTSVNLEFDLNKIEKIRSYIPTEQSVKILGGLLQSFYHTKDGKQRATVVVGPYGRGKSHLLLVLSAITSLDLVPVKDEFNMTAQQVQMELCEKIARVDSAVGALAYSIIESNIRTLPVIINSNSGDVNQSFLVALHESLRNAGLEQLLPDTHFDAAIELIDKWESAIPGAYKLLKSQLKQRKGTVDELYTSLKQFDPNAYNLFVEIYPSIAAGTEFNPLMNRDVVKLYTSVTSALCEQTNFSGIHIIFDEFSKFLEANLEKSKMLNFKIIQDIAEAATRSGEQQLHFTCITHKDILDYSASDSFKTVEGRFHKVQFIASAEESYELISNAIIKKDGFRAFAEKNKQRIDSVAETAMRVNVFQDIEDSTYLEKIVYGCYPLTPVSAFALLRISELVGQNERTLFTFLSQTDTGTLSTFLTQPIDPIQFIEVDYIYDYFKALFRKEIFNESIHSIWAKTNAALLQTKQIEQRRILKAIAIISMIGDPRLRPSPVHIKATLLISDEKFEKAIVALQKAHILSQRENSEFVLLTANGVDIQKSINQYVKTRLTKINICQVLTDACDPDLVIPRIYNDQFSMLRFFRTIYLDEQTFLKFKDPAQILAHYPSDGLIIRIVQSSDELAQQVQDKILQYAATPQIVFCMSKLPFRGENILKQALAITQLKQTQVATQDPHYLEELLIFEEDVNRQIATMIYEMYAPASEHSYYLNGQGSLSVTNRVSLSQAISHICSDCYCQTPIINNEMVNKRVLNAQNIKGRGLVIDWILTHSYEAEIPLMEGSGAEVSIFNSVFKCTGLVQNERIDDVGMNAALDLIDAFVCSAERIRQGFRRLYQELMSPPFGIRKGVIPLLLAYGIRQYKDNIVIYNKGKEIALSAELLNQLNEAPERYQLFLEAGTQERTQYMQDLERLFSSYADVRTNGLNQAYRVVSGMQGWARSLPEYTKKFTTTIDGVPIETNLRSFRSELLKYEVNVRELLFQTLTGNLVPSSSMVTYATQIASLKEKLDGHLLQSRKLLNEALISLFAPEYQGGLSRAIIGWYQSLSKQVQCSVFDQSTNALLSYLKDLSSYDDDKLLDKIIQIYVSIAIEDWNDRLADEFISHIQYSIQTVGEANYKKSDDVSGGKVSIVIDDVSVEKHFSVADISPLGETLLNNLRAIFDEYGEAIEPDEKMSILTNLMKELTE